LFGLGGIALRGVVVRELWLEVGVVVVVALMGLDCADLELLSMKFSEVPALTA
jgi:hypothetical protein